MDHPLVIARAFEGEPLKRVALGHAAGLIYLANPDLIQTVESGDTHPVGFPASDVYVFDETSFSDLEMEWRRSKNPADEVWRKLQRFKWAKSATHQFKFGH